MKAIEMTFSVESELASAFAEAVLKSNLSVDVLLGEFMRAYVNDANRFQMGEEGHSPEERRSRQAAVDFAVASVGLEGFTLSQDHQNLLMSFVQGETSLVEFANGAIDLVAHKDGGTITPEELNHVEAFLAGRRIVELVLEPVRGNFDVTHLKEINRKIFQDFPGAGFDGVTPGEFRPAPPPGGDWQKNRRLFSQPESFFVFYSRMEQADQARLAKALESAKPDELCRLNRIEFAERIAKLYSELDYIHPFSDGNSRTLRSFTRQLAYESGYDLDWTRFNRSLTSRDVLCIARDLSVNKIARSHLQSEHSMRKLLSTQDRLEGNRNLAQLLPDAVSRCICPESTVEGSTHIRGARTSQCEEPSSSLL